MRRASLLAVAVLLLGFAGRGAAQAPPTPQPVVPPSPPAPIDVQPRVDLPDEIKGDVGDFVAVRPETNCPALRFVAIDAGLRVFPSDMLSDKRATVVSAASAGRYRLLAYGALGGEASEPEIVTIVLGGSPPVPPGPQPPGPGPAPIPTAGLRVLILEEREDRDTLPRQMQETLSSLEAGELRQWLDTHCAKGTDGTPEWRMLDDDQTGEYLGPVWQEALKLGHQSLPWLVASNGKGGFQGPLSADAAEVQRTLTAVEAAQ